MLTKYRKKADIQAQLMILQLSFIIGRFTLNFKLSS